MAGGITGFTGCTGFCGFTGFCRFEVLGFSEFLTHSTNQKQVSGRAARGRAAANVAR